MIENQNMKEFLDDLSSKRPIPGGGGASAIAGALGNALGQMVANLTVGKKRYVEVEEEIQSLLTEMKGLEERFLELAAEDAKVFEPLSKAYSLPAGTEEEKAVKETVMEQNLFNASLVPVKIMETAITSMEILEVLALKGSRMAVSDVGVGIQFARAALLGAVMNVYINTKSMRNREKADELNTYADLLATKGTAQADRIYDMVKLGLR